MFSLFFLTGSITLIIFVLTYFLALILKNNGIVDILWGLGFVVIAAIAYYFGSDSFVAQLIFGYVIAWGLRLALHINARNWGRGEDFRYAQWRKDWGKSFFVRSFFQIFLLQWILMQIVAIPIVLGITGTLVIPLWQQYLGMLIWLTGFFFEAVGDYQLTKFKKNKSNKGKLMTTGLWSLTRHPNYFGEALLWWGVAVLAYGVTGNIYSFLGPIAIDFLLLFVSGIPMLEKKYQGRADWKLYTRKTSAFIPMPPRK